VRYDRRTWVCESLHWIRAIVLDRLSRSRGRFRRLRSAACCAGNNGPGAYSRGGEARGTCPGSRWAVVEPTPPQNVILRGTHGSSPSRNTSPPARERSRSLLLLRSALSPVRTSITIRGTRPTAPVHSDSREAKTRFGNFFSPRRYAARKATGFRNQTPGSRGCYSHPVRALRWGGFFRAWF